ncbi:hypothetical protein [Saccharothrix sp.]|uniref:hypothetical protein n=1 Tax=Saccharothrix sp. TaxID=1873460 RepID=UPI0028119F15|nr:hypothetical protein [Saccharothrix sp.]
MAEPTRTPWNSLNARLEAPGGLQLTLFTELGEPTEHEPTEPTEHEPTEHAE